MANVTSKNVIYLDTFTSAVDFTTFSGHTGGMYVDSIEWSGAITQGHTCKIRIDGSAGPYIVDWKCAVGDQGNIKYFDGKLLNLYIDASGVGSGVVIVVIR